MEEKTVSVRNGMFETKLRTGGSGEPLLYLHGAGGLRAWDPFLAELAKSFTVYAPSHPGLKAVPASNRSMISSISWSTTTIF